MKSFLIECAEINYFTIEVDAENENEARELAHQNINKFDVIDEWVSEWDINDVKELDEDGCAK
jgi:tRNA G10  N-methylase Trm11